MSWQVHLPAFILAFTLFGGFLSPVVSFAGNKARNVWVCAVSGVVMVLALMLLYRVNVLGPQVYVFGATSWNLALPSGMAWPVRIILEVDSFNALVGAIASVAIFAGVLYSVKFVEKFSSLSWYSALYMILAAGTLGMIFTGDLFNFFVFLEVASVASFGLIAFWRDRPEAVEASFKYMLVSQIAAMMVLVALGFIYGRYGVLNMAAIGSAIQPGLVEKVALVFLFVALAMKCGAFPMHFWMPDAYAEAPASVTNLLVVTSQASLVVLCRLMFSIYGTAAGTSVVAWTMIVLGCLSMFGGVTMAVIQHEMKRLIGYHSVSQVGYMLLAFGVGLLAIGDSGLMNEYGATAIKGGIFHTINYIMYKGLLFLCAGAVYYAAKTRDLNSLGGLARKMPITGGIFLIAAAAISGMPPFNGFVSKFMIYESVFAVHPILAVVALVTSVLTLASFVKVYQTTFLGAEREKFADVREVPRSMLVGMSLVAVVIIALSLFPGWTVDKLVGPAADALINKAVYVGTIMGGGF